MPPSPKLPSLTLIVAVTPSGGIGRAGTLPWPRIKSEMAYFARVTKRVMPTGTGTGTGTGTNDTSTRKNAVVMGRKTWESIPAKFRPLPGRINVVVSRSADTLDLGLSNDAATKAKPADDPTYAAASLQDGLRQLVTRHEADLGRVFVIGGAQIYAEALKQAEADSVLLTRIAKDYECDTFFPVKFGDAGDDQAKGWTRASEQQRDDFLGEQDTTGGEEWEVELWRRERTEA